MGWTRVSSIDMGEGSCYWWYIAKHRVIESRNLHCSVFVNVCY